MRQAVCPQDSRSWLCRQTSNLPRVWKREKLILSAAAWNSDPEEVVFRDD